MSNNSLQKTQPLNEESKWDKSKIIVSKTDINGTIIYVNDAFEEASEFNKIELLGEPHNIIRHPDMPKVIFKKLWNALKNGENYHAIIKNITRTGRYYWVITDFEIECNGADEIVAYTGRRRAIPRTIEDKMISLYNDLLQIEKIKGEEASELYLQAFLEEEAKMCYEDYVVNLLKEGLSGKEIEAKKVLNNKTPKNTRSNFIRSLFIKDHV